MPLVTVIAACYNHERFVIECLEGIRAQTYSNIQLIITDDCSTDHSVEIINDWIKVFEVECLFIKHTVNKGFPKTLNEALSLTKGKYISIISTDDVWLPGFIEDRVTILEKAGNDYGLVYGKSYKIDENGLRLPGLIKNSTITPQGYVIKELLESCFIPANTVLIRFSVYDDIGMYDEDLIIEDYDLWLRIGQKYKFAYSSQILAKKRILDNSLYLNPDNRNQIRLTLAKIFIKQLDQYPDYRSLIDKQLIIYREDLYRADNPLSKRYLWLGLKEKRTIRDLLMFIFASLHIPYGGFIQICQRLIFFRSLLKDHRGID